MLMRFLKRSFAYSALTLLVLMCNTSIAGVLLTYSSSPNPILQGGSGSIDVSLTNQDLLNPSQDIVSFAFDLTAPTGITFDGLDFPLGNYIYGGLGESFAIVNSLPLEVANTGSTISASDLWNPFPVPGKFLNAGETVLLATIQFTVAADATPGLNLLTFSSVELLRFDLTAFDFAPVDDLTIESPGINIVGSVNTVPEPTSILAFLTLTGLAAFKRRRVLKHS
jgi:hypothetical protein